MAEIEYTWIDWVTFIGSITSTIGFILTLIGLYFTYRQLIKTRKSSEAALLASEETISRLNREISITQLSKHIVLIDTVGPFLRQDNFDIAEIRMNEIRSMLLELKENPEANRYCEAKEVEDLLGYLNIDIHNIRNKIDNPSAEIIINKVINNIDLIKQFLETVMSRLKYHKENGQQNTETD